MGTLDERLTKLVIQAIGDPSKWERALQHIISKTDATAAIVTLRERESCQIVDDLALTERHHSPLIQGFSAEAIQFYLTKLRTIDPWAAAQKKSFPHLPTLMSTICPASAVPDHRFFEWLAEAGMTDTVVFAIDHVPGYWTACNFFLEGNDPDAAHRLLDYSNVHFDLIRNAWQASQKLVRCQQAGKVVFEQLAQYNIPACVTDENAQVLLTNSEFNGLLDLGIARLSGPHRRLSLCKNIMWVDDESGFEKRASSHTAVDEPADIAVTPFEPDPLYRDRREKLWLVTFGHRGNTRNLAPLMRFDLQKLDTQERAFFDGVKTGLNVEEAGQKIGVARSRSFEIWASIRVKLHVKSIHQLQQ